MQVRLKIHEMLAERMTLADISFTVHADAEALRVSVRGSLTLDRDRERLAFRRAAVDAEAEVHAPTRVWRGGLGVGPEDVRFNLAQAVRDIRRLRRMLLEAGR
jgi:hypothetical protein